MAPRLGGRACGRVSLSRVTPGMSDYQDQCIASPRRVQPRRHNGARDDEGQSEPAPRPTSGLEGAIIPCVYEPIERRLLAQHLSQAIAAGGAWTADAVAERAASALDRWPRWLDSLALTVGAGDPSRAQQRPRRELSDLIARFLAAHTLPEGEPEEPPQIIRLISGRDAGTPRPKEPPRQHHNLAHDWPIAQIESVAELADRLELSAGQLAWLADVKGWERTARDLKLRNYRYAGSSAPQRAAAPDRGAEGASQGDPALDPARGPEPGAAAPRRAWLHPEPLGAYAC